MTDKFHFDRYTNDYVEGSDSMKRYQTALKGMDLERLEAELTSIYEAEYLDHSERRIKIIAIEQEVVVRKKEAIANKTTIVLGKNI